LLENSLIDFTSKTHCLLEQLTKKACLDLGVVYNMVAALTSTILQHFDVT